MYVIDQKNNSVSPLIRKSFSELGFKERQHLQEWIAADPKMLGQELLIIQKEFDGWSNSRERIDLLAIDKDGALVVIENKLDDSGKDVAWQAIKYAAYCSSLTKLEIIAIFEKHLRSTGQGEESAESLIADFLETDDFDEISLNESQNQKIILVGAKFRNEVTATCLWLLNHKIDVKCIRIEPYVKDNQIFLNIDQIIPPPEAAEYMIKIGTKEIEEKSQRGSTRQSHNLRIKYFTLLLENLTGEAAKIYATRNPGKDHWLSGATGISGVHYSFSFLKNAIRVELATQRSVAEENKKLFDHLFAQKNTIEDSFGAQLNWMRLDHKIASRIVYEIEFDSYDQENWPEAMSWMNDHMNKLIHALMDNLKNMKKSREFST